jgi:type IV secretion system protein VirB4
VLTYLFHRLEERFDGAPTLLVLDEAWVFLDHPLFAARIREWLKVLRKKNVAVLFATQSLADIAQSSIAPAIIESCPQRIFLPNERAGEPQSRAAYARFGLNERQIELISRATPKRDYYLQSRRGNRLFDLKLGAIARAFCGAGDPASQQLIDAILEDGKADFARRLLEARGLAWAAALIDQPHQAKER